MMNLNRHPVDQERDRLRREFESVLHTVTPTAEKAQLAMSILQSLKNCKSVGQLRAISEFADIIAMLRMVTDKILARDMDKINSLSDEIRLKVDHIIKRLGL